MLEWWPSAVSEKCCWLTFTWTSDTSMAPGADQRAAYFTSAERSNGGSHGITRLLSAPLLKV